MDTTGAAARWFAGRPHLIVVGMEKCGTTSLDALLRPAAGVACPREKETFALSLHREKGLAWYKDQYPDDWDGPIVDITPSYFRDPDALDRMAALPSRVTVGILLRHPLKRAYSHYLHAIDRYVGRREARWDVFAALPRHDFRKVIEDRRRPFVTLYAPLLRDLFARFGEAHVVPLVFEDMARDPAPAIAAIEEAMGTCLGVPTDAALPRTNPTSLPRVVATRRGATIWHDGLPVWRAEGTEAKTLLAQAATWTLSLPENEARAAMDQLFAADVAETEALLGRKIPAWQEVGALHAPQPPRPLTLRWTRDVARRIKETAYEVIKGPRP